MKDAVKERVILRPLISEASTAQFGDVPGVGKKLLAGVVSAWVLLAPAHAGDVELLPSPAAENSSLSRVVSDESGNQTNRITLSKELLQLIKERIK